MSFFFVTFITFGPVNCIIQILCTYITYVYHKSLNNLLFKKESLNPSTIFSLHPFVYHTLIYSITNGDWAARHTLNSAAFNVNGHLSERLPLQNKKKRPIRNNNRSEECGTSCFRGEGKNLFASIAHEAWFDKSICESDG